ncbi:MAG: hypothetical protein V2I39_01065 [Erythrobacter sp.]|nr:hypothetical protein [Erythrobacter sp.]
MISPAQSVQGGGSGDGADSEGAAEEEPAGDAPAQRLAMAETGWLTVGRDGSVFTTQFDADGTYRDYRNGEFVQSGTWRRREDGLLCFSPAEQDRLGTCWETRGLDEDGTMRALDPDGRAIELRRVSYLPPAAAEEADGTEEETAG